MTHNDLLTLRAWLTGRHWMIGERSSDIYDGSALICAAIGPRNAAMLLMLLDAGLDLVEGALEREEGTR